MFWVVQILLVCHCICEDTTKRTQCKLWKCDIGTRIKEIQHIFHGERSDPLDWLDGKAKQLSVSITNAPWCVHGVAMGYITVSDRMNPDAMWHNHCHPVNISKGEVPSIILLEDMVYLLLPCISKAFWSILHPLLHSADPSRGSLPGPGPAVRLLPVLLNSVAAW